MSKLLSGPGWSDTSDRPDTEMRHAYDREPAERARRVRAERLAADQAAVRAARPYWTAGRVIATGLAITCGTIAVICWGIVFSLSGLV